MNGNRERIPMSAASKEEMEQLGKVWLGLCTESAREELAAQWSDSWTTDPSMLQSKRDRFRRIQRTCQQHPDVYATCDQDFHAIAEIEPTLRGLLVPPSDLEKESYHEMLFLRPLLQPLNFIPYLLLFWSTLRVYLLPGLSLLFPLLTLLAPYFILAYLYHVPITLQGYMAILQSMIAGNVNAVLDPTTAATSEVAEVAPLARLKQLVMVGMTLVQSVIQPYWSHQHLKTVDTTLQQKGEVVLRFHAHYVALQQRLEAHGIFFYRSPFPPLRNPTDARMAVANLLLHPMYYRLALRYIGRLEILLRLAHHPDTHPVHWIRSPTPILRVLNTYDLHLMSAPQKDKKNKTPITRFSVSLDTRHGIHALLTGPNKGGKSTVLRAVAINVRMAHQYGCGIGTLRMTPFKDMQVCLKPDDLPGSKSRFEREIEFTAGTLHGPHGPHGPQGHRLVLIDELYHSTNPPDALRSCQIYSAALWKQPMTASIISTHLFEWVTSAPDTIQRLCCPARRHPDGHVEFIHTVQPGICTVSSVDDLLVKNGLSVCCEKVNKKKRTSI